MPLFVGAVPSFPGLHFFFSGQPGVPGKKKRAKAQSVAFTACSAHLGALVVDYVVERFLRSPAAWLPRCVSAALAGVLSAPRCACWSHSVVLRLGLVVQKVGSQSAVQCCSCSSWCKQGASLGAWGSAAWRASGRGTRGGWSQVSVPGRPCGFAATCAPPSLSARECPADSSPLEQGNPRAPSGPPAHSSSPAVVCFACGFPVCGLSFCGLRCGSPFRRSVLQVSDRWGGLGTPPSSSQVGALPDLLDRVVVVPSCSTDLRCRHVGKGRAGANDNGA